MVPVKPSHLARVRLAAFLLLVALVGLPACRQVLAPPVPVPYERLPKNTIGMLAVPFAGVRVFRTQAAWDSLWQQYSFSTISEPVIDFDRQQVVGIYYGQLSSGCYSAFVWVTGAQRYSDRIEVSLGALPEFAGCDAIQHPLDMVVMDASSLPVVFVGNVPEARNEQGELLATLPQVPLVPPAHVRVQHILVGFEGSIPGKTITRDRTRAALLAQSFLDKARRGQSFDSLVARYTDDQYPGIYAMSNDGVSPGPGEFSRGGIVKGFGDVSFSMMPGNIGIVAYDSLFSPYGWHIIKRLE